jgi:hypothetical protein
MTDLDVIYAYTRAQAIEDGEQVLAEGELAEVVKNNHYKYPLFITSNIWYLIDIASHHGGDRASVLDRILADSHKPKTEEGDTRFFSSEVAGSLHDFYIQCGATDIEDPTPCLTLMAPADL